jgi:uncharacterized FAD-dependent dehydrogenase
MRKPISVAIIGGGPAGLSALHSLKDQNVLLIEKGTHINKRKHRENEDLNIGIGGAGLFSDGKFSYYPSGTNLYKLARTSDLIEAYENTSNILNSCNIKSIPYPSTFLPPNRKDLLKTYPSFYGGLDDRIDLVNKLVSGADEKIMCNTEVISIQKIQMGYVLNCRNETENFSIITSSIILSTGKFSFDSFLRKRRLRYDIGIRIETKHNISLFNKSKYPDVKLIWKRNNLEIRTFCTCKKGEVWGLEYENYSCLSGRSDGRDTEFSNFGLLIRYQGESFDRGRRIYEKTIKELENNIYYQSLDGFLNNNGVIKVLESEERPWFPKAKFKPEKLMELMPAELYSDLSIGLNCLLKEVPDLDNEYTYCLFPAIEGSGAYYEHEDLKIPDENIWVIGDVSGGFRGIIPAMVSGRYVGNYIDKMLKTNDFKVVFENR